MAISVIKQPTQPKISVVKPTTQSSISVTKPVTQPSLSVAKTVSPQIAKAQTSANVVGNVSATPAKQTYIDNKLREFYRDSNSSNLVDKNTGQVISATEFGIGTPTAGKGFKEVSNPNQVTQPAGIAQVQPTATPTATVAQTETTQPVANTADTDAFKKAYTDYIATLGASPEVASARKAYTDYLANYLAGKNELTGRAVETGNVPLGLLRGQQERLADQAQPELTRLEGAANLAQQARTEQQAQVKAGVEMAQSLLPSTQVINGNVVRVNPLTGKSEVLYSSPTQLSAGASLIDPNTGKVIAQAEKAPGTQTASIQEYEYYANQEKQAGRTPKSYSEYQTEDANRKAIANNILSSGLNKDQQAVVLGLRTKFESNPVVQRYAKAVEAKNMVDSLAQKKTLSSSDAQGLVYAFAKAMDPDSVVREGEYATVQKYAQSWLNQFGFQANRILNGETFLSPQAVKDMKNTIDSKYNSTQGVYNQFRNDTINLGNLLTGGQDVSKFFTDYASAENESTPTTTNQSSQDGWF